MQWAAAAGDMHVHGGARHRVAHLHPAVVLRAQDCLRVPAMSVCAHVRAGITAHARVDRRQRTTRGQACVWVPAADTCGVSEGLCGEVRVAPPSNEEAHWKAI